MGIPTQKDFVERLRLESTRWVAGNIIQGPQREAILGLYEAAPTQQKRTGPLRLATIVILFAAVLLCTGIILFYAANWKLMPPAFKVGQVFALLISAYGGAYYLLAVREQYLLIGRILLYAGMVSYGAGIMLIAQIFHISAHPANGVLAWALGVAAMSWVMKEKWGLFFAGALFLIWNGWEFFAYHSPNYAFIGVPLLLGLLLYRVRSSAGMTFSFFGILIYFYQINVHWLRMAEAAGAATATHFALMHIPLGVIFIGLGWIYQGERIIGAAARIAAVVGWIAIAVPFLFVSWPTHHPTAWLVLQRGALVFSLEWAVLLIVAWGVALVMRKRGLDVRLPIAALLYSALLLVLPLGNTATRMIVLHLGLLALMFGLLILFGHRSSGRATERFLSFFFVISLVAIKCIGLLGLGLARRDTFVAYGIGGLIFCLVVFLLAQLVAVLNRHKQRAFSPNGISGACAMLVFVLIYSLSFKMPEQRSIFGLDPIVLQMLVLFISTALALYSALWIRGAERLPIMLSGIIFAIATTVLLVTRPGISWVVYSLVFNAVLFVTTGVLVYYSTRVNSRLLLNFSLAGFALHIVTRYFDLFWDLLSGAFLFIATGALGIVVGWLLERNRRKLLLRMGHPKKRGG